MIWNQSGAEGSDFKAKAAAEPGWYWVFRPRNLGPNHYDAEDGMVLLVWADDDGGVHSPLADLRGAADMSCRDDRSGQVLQSWFAGPVAPSRSSGFLALDGRRTGEVPKSGWQWCRTEVPLNHVDAGGIGPIFIAEGRDGSPWVWLATRRDGTPVDVGELGFAEPLINERGVIDGHGDVGRVQAEFFGRIASPMGVPAAFPAG